MIFNGLFYNEFHGLFAHADEIHAFGQVGNVDLLFIGVDAARKDGLSHQVGDLVGRVW